MFFLRQLMILRVKAIMAMMAITMKAVDAIVLTTSSDLFLMKNSLGCRTVLKLSESSNILACHRPFQLHVSPTLASCQGIQGYASAMKQRTHMRCTQQDA